MEAHLGVRTAIACVVFAAATLLAGLSGCSQVVEVAPPHSLRVTARDPGGLHPTRMFARSRVVALGDVHGDMAAIREALALAGATDAQGHWIGKDLIVIQLGDVLDRGDDEREILEFLDRLSKEARLVGGRVIQLIGNHEVMNILGDFRYATAAGLNDFDATVGLELSAPAPGGGGELARAREDAFRPGGAWARRMARFNVAVVVGDTLFVHAGIEPEMAHYGLERINRETRLWILGSGTFPTYLDDEDGPVWTRLFDRDDLVACARLKVSLSALRVKRMVVGHSPHLEGISSGCGQAVWRVDTGMSRFFGGRPAVLEIVGDQVRVIGARPSPAAQPVVQWPPTTP